MKKWIAMMLSVLMVFTCVPANVVNATTLTSEEQEVQSQEGETPEEKPEQENPDETQNPQGTDNQDTTGKTEEPAETEETKQPEVKQPEVKQPETTREAADNVKASEQEIMTADVEAEQTEPEETEETEVFEQRLNYLYVESPYLETPAVQNIVVSWGDGTEEITDMTMTVEKEDGSTEEWKTKKDVKNLHLFTKKFDTNEASAYKVTKLQFKQQGILQEYKLDEFNEVSAEFGVNKEYQGYNETKLPLGEDAESAEVESSVVVLDENGNAESKNNIEEALNDVSGGIERLNRTRDAEIVVALDPGHGGKDGGASGNGLQEKDLALKIAKFVKEELETYSGVRVYMTRTTDKYLELKERADLAKKAGAKVLVSLHLNASNGKANGAEVIYPNDHWKPQIGKDGKALAQLIQNELVALGLHDRGIYPKNTVEDKYPDGSTQDWFAIPRYAKQNGMAGIIVEHAFIDNSGNANQFLKSDAGLKKLAIADAKGIAKFLKVEKMGNRTAIEEGTYVLENALDSSKSAAVSGSSFTKGTAVVLNSKNNLPSQRFEVKSAGGGFYYLVAEHSGKVIDVAGGSSAPGTKLQQYNLNNSAAQQWGFIDSKDGYFYVQSKLGTYMQTSGEKTAEGTGLQTAGLTKSEAQKWKLVKAPTNKLVADGTYTISTAIKGNMVADIAGGSSANSANVQVYQSNNTSAQHFEITHVRDGYYKIAAEHSGRVLDVKGGSAANGANLQQYGWNNSDAQLWKFIDAGNGQFYIRSKKNTIITLASSNPVSKTNVLMWEANGSATQKWTLKAANSRPVADGEYVLVSAKAKGGVATEAGGNIKFMPYDNTANQKYKVQYVGNGYYKIILKSNGQSLHVANSSASAKANLQSYKASDSSAQLWKFINAGGGAYYIKSKLGTVIELAGGKTAAGTNMQMYTMNGTPAQKWMFDSRKASVAERPFENGTYTIKAGNNGGLVLDVASGSRSNSANVRLYNSNNSSAQKYELYYVGNGYYKVTAEHSDKALDVKGGSGSAGANVQQYGWNGSAAQLWKFIDAGNGKYYIKSQKGTVLDLASGKTANKSNVQMNNMDVRSTQYWTVAQAGTAPIANGTYSFRSSSSNKQVLEVAGASTANLANVRLNGYGGLVSQQFEIAHVKNGYYKMTVKHSGKVLEADAQNYRNGSNVRQNRWNGSDAQLWKFVKASNGVYFIKSKLGLALDIQSGKIQAGTNIQMYTSNGSGAQKWVPRLEKEYQAVEVKEGIYTIQSALNANRVLDIAGGSTANKANLQIYVGNDSAAQRFRVQKVSGGYYKIISERSGKALDVSDASMLNKANAWQYTWNGSAAQLWKFVDAGNGKYYIQSKLGTVLDVSGGNIAKGTNVQLYGLNSTTAQKWVLDDNRAKLYPIMGKTGVTVDQMVKFYEERVKKVPNHKGYPYTADEKSGAKTIKQFCQIFLEECNAEGVKAEVAFAQSMKETAFLKFGGDVVSEQYNFAGLGTTGGGVKGEYFANVRQGVRAQVQHLKAYASKEPLKQACVDKRFTYVQRGVAEYVQWLGMQENPHNTDKQKYGWAAGVNYGYSLVDDYILPLKAIK